MPNKLKTVLGLALIGFTYYLESLIPRGEYDQAVVGASILALTALAKGGKSIYDYYQNRKNAPNAYADTAQGKRLAELQKTGAYSGAHRNEIIGATNRVATGSAETNRANYMGRIANMGQGGSIAAQRGLNEIEGNRGRIVANEAGRVTAMNEQSKIQAANEYATGSDARADQIKQYNANTNKELVGGLAGAATGYLGGRMTQELNLQKFGQYQELNMTPGERIMAQIQAGSGEPQANDLAGYSAYEANQGGQQAPAGYQGSQSPYSLPPEMVSQVQAMLVSAGFNVSVDGIMGPQTQEALRQYQAQQ